MLFLDICISFDVLRTFKDSDDILFTLYNTAKPTETKPFYVATQTHVFPIFP